MGSSRQRTVKQWATLDRENRLLRVEVERLKREATDNAGKLLRAEGRERWLCDVVIDGLSAGLKYINGL